ncbi:hypothetical protein AJ79_09786 [Helicocarpus griseus UAMH5409]|uniref:FAD-binding PCMH-type domain-containing protein n=1 Tax=Helicocarpus griseus UAMH5409 TaxID=1447875 RepID=A0A2B7WH28_9EURO|nr:hypothetical protein AJ79_09786 [Helicocarpus griseus UAMH5409]
MLTNCSYSHREPMARKLLRGQQLRAVQWKNWESRPRTNESCEIGSDPAIPCGQGNIAPYSVIADSVDHIQQAVLFAQKHNLRLVIRNTGHDFSGRSTAPLSLQIFTHNLKNITFSENFVPEGGGKDKACTAVTIGAGVQLAELYDAVGTRGQMVVGGYSHGVGAAGGYVQGGGHSILGPWKGMASDLALEFIVVMASGEILTANKHKNSDLFWALRGGGGGTFGVVVSVTLRTFEDAAITVATVNLRSETADMAYWQIVRSFIRYLPAISGNGRSGNLIGTPMMPAADGTSTTADLSMKLYFVNESSVEKTKRLLLPFTEPLKDLAGNRPQLNITTYQSVSEFYVTTLGAPDFTGSSVLFLSRLISHRFLASSRGPGKLSEAIQRLGYNATDTFSINFVAGDQVARNGAAVDSALNPAWREALVHVILSHGWLGYKSFDDQRQVQDGITHHQEPILRSLEPGRMGAYLNEANPQQQNFQHEFWGNKYPRLYAIKRHYDPFDLFITRLGVGSENWDDEGVCRL